MKKKLPIIITSIIILTLIIIGFFIALKGKDGEAELESSKKAMEILNVKLFDTLEFTLPGTDNQRKIYVFKKVSPTPKKYPRQAGKPTKSPL